MCFGEREGTHFLPETIMIFPLYLSLIRHWEFEYLCLHLHWPHQLCEEYTLRIFVNLIALSSVMFWSGTASSHLAGRLYWAMIYLCSIDQNLNTTCLSKKKKKSLMGFITLLLENVAISHYIFVKQTFHDSFCTENSKILITRNSAKSFLFCNLF